MNIYESEIKGIFIIEPAVINISEDESYVETMTQQEFEEKVSKTVFVQDNESKSVRGVVRGLHFQKPPYTQAKLVSVIEGMVLDVSVDLRKGSPTYGMYVAIEISGENHRKVFIPKGFAHGFSVLSDVAIFQYRCDEYYNPKSEDGIAWDDPDLAIDWRLRTEEISLSEKDRNRPFLRQYKSPF